MIAQHAPRIAESAAAVSVSTAAVSFFADTLIYIQWMAGFVAILSGLTAIAWICYKFLHGRRD